MARRPADMTVSREAILLAAADVLYQRGYAATTMKAIAEQVRLTAGTLYHYFPHKDALVLAVLEMGLEAGIARIQPLAEGPQPPAERLRAMIEAHIRGLTEHPAIGAAMVFELKPLARAAQPRDHSDAFQQQRRCFFERRDQFEALFTRVVREGVAAGDFRPVDAALVVKALLGAQNWVGVWYREGGRLTGAAVAARMADVLITGVLA